MRGRRLTFRPDVFDLGYEDDELGEHLIRIDGRAVNCTFTGAPDPMAEQLRQVLFALAGPEGSIRSAATLRNIKHSMTCFFITYLDEIDPGRVRYQSLADIDVATIDAFDSKAEPLRYKVLGGALRGLRAFWRMEEAAGRSPESPLERRLSFVSHHKKAEYEGRDAIPVPILRQMRATALSIIRHAAKRIRAGRALVDGLRRKDPASLAVWEKVQLAIVDGREAIASKQARAMGLGHGGVMCSDLHWNVHLSEIECMAFIIALGTAVRIEYECLRAMRRGCLQDDDGKRATLTYWKGRRPNSPASVLRVDSGRATSPGSMVRLACDLTSFSAECLAFQGRNHKDLLWCGYSKATHLCEFNFDDAWLRYFARYPIRSPDGAVISAPHPGKMRKSIKREEYRRSLGHLKAFSSDHSERVAVKHYANIPSLRDLHYQTIEDGLNDAFAAAMEPVVVAEADDLGQQADILGLPAEQSETSTWFASCTALRHSPFGRDGEICPTPFEQCLHCRNAVITSRRLPNILRFKRLMEDARGAMGDGDWRARFAASYRRIVDLILPRFPADVIAAAAVSASEASSDGLDQIVRLRGL